MKFLPLLALHTFQLLLSLNAAYHSFLAIQALRSVESTAKKAANISKAAAEQLRRTRSTEAAGVAAVSTCLQFLWSGPVCVVLSVGAWILLFCLHV
jgi:hypothetical protein